VTFRPLPKLAAGLWWRQDRRATAANGMRHQRHILLSQRLQLVWVSQRRQLQRIVHLQRQEQGTMSARRCQLLVQHLSDQKPPTGSLVVQVSIQLNPMKDYIEQYVRICKGRLEDMPGRVSLRTRSCIGGAWRCAALLIASPTLAAARKERRRLRCAAASPAAPPAAAAAAASAPPAAGGDGMADMPLCSRRVGMVG
jgi:hypothetical protein